MKRGVRKSREEFSIKRFNIRKTIPFKLLIICIILLAILVITWIFIDVPKDKQEDIYKKFGELGSFKWDFNQEKVVLDVLNYNISEDNQTINVTIKWSSGNQIINSILIDFDMGTGNNCNYTIIADLPTFGENKTYYAIEPAGFNSGCSEIDFSNVINVLAYAEVNISLTQINLIQNITFYKDDSRNNLINLKQYFSGLVNINYSLVESPNNENISVSVDNTTKNISISVLDATWFGAQKFNLTAASDDGDVLNTVNSGENMSFYIIAVNANRPAPNEVPEFISENCSNLVIDLKITSNLIINMKNCFKDNDILSFRFDNSSMKNISISKDSNNLTLTPKAGFIGKEYLTLYANDSISEEYGRVYVNVINSTIVNKTNTSVSVVNDPKITSSSPSTSNVSMFPGNKTFSVIAQNYEIIKWYLNGGIIAAAEGKLLYDFSNLKEGDIVKVEVINGTRIDSKTWNIKIEEDGEGETPVFDIGTVIFYSIVAVICIIILLIVWLFIIEKNKGAGIKSGFGVSDTKSNVKISRGRGSNVDYFNIPG